MPTARDPLYQRHRFPPEGLCQSKLLGRVRLC
jgi:putative transposase